jgi:hypothetical protein
MISLRTAGLIPRDGNALSRSPSRSPSPKKSREVLMLEEKINELQEQIKKYKLKMNELKYRPGGVGYEKSKLRFKEGLKKQLRRPISPKRSQKQSPKKAKSM